MKLFSEQLSTNLVGTFLSGWEKLFENDVQNLRGIREFLLRFYPPFHDWIATTPSVGLDSDWNVSVWYEKVDITKEEREVRLGRTIMDSGELNTSPKNMNMMMKVYGDLVKEKGCAKQTANFRAIDHVVVSDGSMENVFTDVGNPDYLTVSILKSAPWALIKKQLEPLFPSYSGAGPIESIRVNENEDLDIYFQWLLGHQQKEIALNIWPDADEKEFARNKRNVSNRIANLRNLLDPNRLHLDWNP